MGLISNSADIMGRVVKLTRHGGLFQSNPRLWALMTKTSAIVSSSQQLTSASTAELLKTFDKCHCGCFEHDIFVIFSQKQKCF